MRWIRTAFAADGCFRANLIPCDPKRRQFPGNLAAAARRQWRFLAPLLCERSPNKLWRPRCVRRHPCPLHPCRGDHSNERGLLCRKQRNSASPNSISSPAPKPGIGSASTGRSYAPTARNTSPNQDFLTKDPSIKVKVPAQLRATDTTTLTWDQLRAALDDMESHDRVCLELDMTNALRPSELFAVPVGCNQPEMNIVEMVYKGKIRQRGKTKSDLTHFRCRLSPLNGG